MAKISGSDVRPGMVIEHDGSRAAGEKVEVSTDEVAYVRQAE
jgi:hypothetical protein